jgi:DNA polymerase I
MHVIVDGNSIAHWRFWATPQRKDSDGHEVGMLVSLIEWLHEAERSFDSKAVVCLDAPRNWRYDLQPDYKGQRTEKHPALVEQLDRLADWLVRYGFFTEQVDGFEADDLCARRAGLAENATVISRDKDLRQLVDDARRVRCFDPVARVMYDEAAVLQKHGVPPYRLRELLAICGDAADNVRGVPQWGEDTTAKAIEETIDFEHLCAAARALELRTVSERKQRTFRECEPKVMQNYELVGFRFPSE